MPLATPCARIGPASTYPQSRLKRGSRKRRLDLSPSQLRADRPAGSLELPQGVGAARIHGRRALIRAGQCSGEKRRGDAELLARCGGQPIRVMGEPNSLPAAARAHVSGIAGFSTHRAPVESKGGKKAPVRKRGPSPLTAHIGRNDHACRNRSRSSQVCSDDHPRRDIR